MKTTLFLCLLLSASLLTAQEKGVSPAAAPSGAPVGTTYAVVVGISDYQDPGIPDLKYAHRDAEAFAEWLQRPEGGSVPADNIQLLLNENATKGGVAVALWELLTQCGEGDQIIIYFSGHGDVETKTTAQPGYWLCFDAPPAVYVSGGCFNVRDLQDIVSTLSGQNKARVLFISDACHAGKLAGSERGGAQITAANLAKQFAREVKILSCQPDQFSLEGEEWGGGRGCFSYHLTEGLYGLADRNGDNLVTLFELNTYLGERVPEETAPYHQFPIAIGDMTTCLAHVDPQKLARIKAGNIGAVPVEKKIELRGMEASVLESADSLTRTRYHAFLKALNEDRDLLAATDSSANTLFAQLMATEVLKPLHSTLRYKFTAALIDKSQQAINALLVDDPYKANNWRIKPDKPINQFETWMELYKRPRP
ncbi:MAG: caspase family protein [Bacteroidetes bacterium]|nr:MAG: caspase family protein [Bacteroidota bacterium]